MAAARDTAAGAFSPRAMSSPSLRSRRGAKEPGAATPSRSPPRGPFVLPQDRPPRRPRGSGASDASADADPAGQWCGWMCRLCTYKEAPEWSVHNKYIHTGYRTGFGWRAAVRSVRVPPNPAPALSLSSVRRASTSPSRVSPSPRVFGVASSAPDVPTSPARARVRPPRSPADARPRPLAPSRAGAHGAQRDGEHLDPSRRPRHLRRHHRHHGHRMGRAPHASAPGHVGHRRERHARRARRANRPIPTRRRGFPRRPLRPRDAIARRIPSLRVDPPEP